MADIGSFPLPQDDPRFGYTMPTMPVAPTTQAPTPDQLARKRAEVAALRGFGRSVPKGEMVGRFYVPAGGAALGPAMAQAGASQEQAELARLLRERGTTPTL